MTDGYVYLYNARMHTQINGRTMDALCVQYPEQHLF